jgi:hypothetical protein
MTIKNKCKHAQLARKSKSSILLNEHDTFDHSGEDFENVATSWTISASLFHCTSMI